MRTDSSQQSAWRAGVLAHAAMVVAFAGALFRAAHATADDIPSLSSAISSSSVDVWSGGPSLLAPSPSNEYALPGPSPAGPSLEPVPAPADDGVPPCTSCNQGAGGAGYPYNRCGCQGQMFPWFTGPGACDQWCVGPHWNVQADGLIILRGKADWGRIDNAVTGDPSLVQQFDHAPGARIFVTGYNQSSFGMQVGYEGVNDFRADQEFPDVGALRVFDYRSRFNSLEVNFMRKDDLAWKFFAGVRFIQLDDNLSDFTTVDKPIPAPATPPAANAAFVDFGNSFKMTNRLIGFQVGGYRDVWQLNRWITIEPYGNAGVYLNNVERQEIARNVTTIVAGDNLSTPANEFFEASTEVDTRVVRNYDDVAFVGEAGVTGVVRLNRCVALRAGYQVFAFDGVGQGLDAFFAPGINSSTLIEHGLRFGVEYQR